ncbi:MAG: hypothetical protein IPK26_15550 [Planctomycetes bacterium]|nr:hypothetical protein [Planctomycetota bacterium]
MLFTMTLAAACAGAPPASPDSGTARSPAAAATKSGAEESAAVRELLRDYGRQVRSSVLRLQGNEPAMADRLRALGDGGALALARLVRAADPAAAEPGGTFVAILVRDAGAAPRVAPALVDLLAAADPRQRAFACEALGYLAWADATPHLKALLADATVVPGYAGEPTIAEFAERALRLLAAGGGS